MTLSPSQARKFYDRFGKRQDTQAFYEDAALDDLVVHADFEHANAVFELGCGTGRFAVRLLKSRLPGSASYFGIDISKTMIDIAARRILPYGERARVALSDGSMSLPLPSQSVDRVVSTYVLDLLSRADIRQAVSEAHRVLTADGKLCLVSLTRGVNLASRVVSGLWSAVFNAYAPAVGGCRPVRLESFLDQQHWSTEYHDVVTQFGVPSEVLIASPQSAPGDS